MEASSRCVTELREEERCDVVIALSHCSLFEDKKVLKAVPGIDLLLGGHDHDPIQLVSGTAQAPLMGEQLVRIPFF